MLYEDSEIIQQYDYLVVCHHLYINLPIEEWEVYEKMGSTGLTKGFKMHTVKSYDEGIGSFNQAVLVCDTRIATIDQIEIFLDLI